VLNCACPFDIKVYLPLMQISTCFLGDLTEVMKADNFVSLQHTDNSTAACYNNPRALHFNCSVCEYSWVLFIGKNDFCFHKTVKIRLRLLKCEAANADGGFAETHLPNYTASEWKRM
jgi:hypothetical protein